MDKSVTSLIDAFDLCTQAVIEESALFGCPPFDDSHCKEDSCDTDFNKVERRLAYLSKFGFFNIKFAEKSISIFLKDYFYSNTIFPQELKVCSLSNGPGLDLIGFFSALNDRNKNFTCLPKLRVLNLYDSWLRIYLSILDRTYEVALQKFYSKCSSVFHKNIQFTQTNIFKDMSAEAENDIRDSNVLLMFRIFNTSKANPEAQYNTLKKIISLLKPGSLIFFTGSKNNLKNISKCADSVKCIFGPQTVKLEKLKYPEFLIDSNTIKPKDSGQLEFIVWQKRGISENQKKTKTISTKQEDQDLKTATCSESMTTVGLNNIEIKSEISSSLISKQSELSSNESIKKSLTSVLNSDTLNTVNSDKDIEEIKNELCTAETRISSAKSVVSISNKIVSDNPAIKSNGVEVMQNKVQRTECGSSPAKATVSVLKNPDIDNNGLKEKQDKSQMVECGTSSAKAVLNKINNPADIKECFQPKVVKSTDDNQHFKKSDSDGGMLANQILSSAPQVIRTEATENKISQDIDSLVEQIIISGDKTKFKDLVMRNCYMILDEMLGFKDTCMKNGYSVSDVKFKDTSLKKIKCPEEMLSPIEQKEVSEKAAKNTPVKIIPKTNKMQLPEGNNSLSAVNKNMSNAATQDKMSGVRNEKSKNIHNFPRNVNTNNIGIQHSTDVNSYDVQALIKRCDSLITVLEKVTDDVKCERNSRCVNEFEEKSCCRAEPRAKFCAPRCCASSVNIRSSCCCSRTLDCCCMKNICSKHCSNSLPCRGSIREQYNFERERCNTSKPFITIPLQDTDIWNILTARKE